jgi:hypothetical protein
VLPVRPGHLGGHRPVDEGQADRFAENAKARARADARRNLGAMRLLPLRERAFFTRRYGSGRRRPSDALSSEAAVVPIGRRKLAGIGGAIAVLIL